MIQPARLPIYNSPIGALHDRERDVAVVPKINVEYLNILVNTIE
jgi:hypothetical protein